MLPLRQRAQLSLRAAKWIANAAVVIALAPVTPAGAAPVSGPQPADERVEQEQRREREVRANSDSAAERDRRRASRRAFRDLTRAEAIEVAQARHPEFMLLPAWRAPALRLGHRISGYESDFVARVAAPDGARDELVVSTVPMRTGAPGAKRPVDLMLERGSRGYRPINPIADVLLGERLADGLRAFGAGVTVRPHVEEQPTAEIAGHTLFYANALPDADIVVRPEVTGFSVHIHVRSEDGPEHYTLNLHADEGVTLRPDHAADVIELRRGGEVIGHVTAPVAQDADGRPVALRWRLEGERLEVDVPHRDRDYAYPLLIDPDVTESFEWERYGADNAGGNFAGWTEGGTGAFANHRWAGGGSAAWLGAGLYIRNLGVTHYYSAGQSGWYAWRAPGYARLTSVEWNLFEHDKAQGTCMELGVAKWPVTSSAPTQGGWHTGHWEACHRTDRNQYVRTWGGATPAIRPCSASARIRMGTGASSQRRSASSTCT